MTNVQISKELHGYIRPGECWHEKLRRLGKSLYYKCAKCNEEIRLPQYESYPDYFTEKGFFIVWEWAKEQDWWYDFIEDNNCSMNYNDIDYKFINYKTFARHVFEYLEGREK